MNRILLLLILGLVGGFHLYASSSAVVPDNKQGKIKIACIGNSITFGAGLNDPFRDAYPVLLGRMLGDKYDVRNFGRSGTTLLRHGDYSYRDQDIFQQAKAFCPNIVIIKLGTNDSKPQNWKFKKEFNRDFSDLIDTLRALPSKPEIYLCTPSFVVGDNFTITNKVVGGEIVPLIKKISKKEKTKLIDIYAVTSEHPELFCDGVHPNEKGAGVLAETVYRALTGKEKSASTVIQPFPGKKTNWNGYDRYDFTISGQETIVVTPQEAMPGNPWIWRPAFFGHEPQTDLALLKKGFHVAYYDITHLYGSPRSIRLSDSFYNYMVKKCKLSDKVSLEGMSRGGLAALNWAIAHPDKTACLYLDNPVCALRSWPGKKRPELWNDFLKEWGLKDDSNFKGNPLDQVQALVKAGVPVFSVCGDADKTVPFEENNNELQRRMNAMGGDIRTIVKPGFDHHPHSLKDPTPIVDFVLQQQPVYQTLQSIRTRGSLENSRYRFLKEKKGRVAFLGGSITEMNGWRGMVMQSLKQRFPDTEFDFINAGIASTGTTPGAFRMVNDVLKNGPVDLLFVEGAVNDDTNGFSAEEQIRGMEGVVRHVLTSNPYTDIIMLHFIYDPFIPQYEKGKIPQVILQHEKVAEHYQIPSIELAQEIAARMTKGELTWAQFGGTHPSLFGHGYYAAAINRLFATMWKNRNVDTLNLHPHILPTAPLDTYSYFNGCLVSPEKAIAKRGFKLIPDWKPVIKVETRTGFVGVPMLEAQKPGSSFRFRFKGTAVGIFCVAGPDAGIIEYRIDGGKMKQLDMFTPWSGGLYIPWVYMFDEKLKDTSHILEVKIVPAHHAESKGNACIIRNFVVNGTAL